MKYKLPGSHKTDLLYHPGTRKTTQVHRYLVGLSKIYPNLDYYQKMGGLKRLWDGYVNMITNQLSGLMTPCQPLITLMTSKCLGGSQMWVYCF